MAINFVPIRQKKKYEEIGYQFRDTFLLINL